MNGTAYMCSNTPVQAMNAQASSSSWSSWCHEKYLDIKYPLYDVLHAATWGAFERLKAFKSILTTRLTTGSFVPCLDPRTSAIPNLIKEFSAKQITRENIENNQVFLPDVLYKGYHPDSIPQTPSRKRLTYIVSRVGSIAKKMNIEKEILVFAVNDTSVPTGAMGGTWFKGLPVVIRFNVKTVNASDAQFDFITAHELFHCKYNHSYKALLFNLAVLTVDAVAAATIVGILLIPFIEGTASMAKHAISKIHEKEADNYAMQILGTNQGAIECFENAIKKNKKIKNNPLIFASTGTTNIMEKITIDGNIRDDLDHPSQTTRLAYAKQWVSRT